MRLVLTTACSLSAGWALLPLLKWSPSKSCPVSSLSVNHLTFGPKWLSLHAMLCLFSVFPTKRCCSFWNAFSLLLWIIAELDVCRKFLLIRVCWIGKGAKSFQFFTFVHAWAQDFSAKRSWLSLLCKCDYFLTGWHWNYQTAKFWFVLSPTAGTFPPRNWIELPCLSGKDSPSITHSEYFFREVLNFPSNWMNFNLHL